MLSGLKRKKFSAGARRVASCAAEAPLMKVTSGTLLAKSRIAMPSMPARGPMTMLAPPSISRRAFATTDSGGSVRGLDHSLDRPLAVALLVLLHGQFVAAQGIPPERLERAFERGEHADFQDVGLSIRLNAEQERSGDQDDACNAAWSARRASAHSSPAPALRAWRRLRHAVPIMLTYSQPTVFEQLPRVSRRARRRRKTL